MTDRKLAACGLDFRYLAISQLDFKSDKTLLFRGMTIEKFPLWFKEKATTTYVISGWIAVQRFFWNIGWNKIEPSSVSIAAP